MIHVVLKTIIKVPASAEPGYHHVYTYPTNSARAGLVHMFRHHSFCRKSDCETIVFVVFVLLRVVFFCFSSELSLISSVYASVSSLLFVCVFLFSAFVGLFLALLVLWSCCL